MASLKIRFDFRKFEPLYYCCIHGRLEDGLHRLQLAKNSGMKTIKVRGHAKCHHFHPGPLKVLSELIRDNKAGNKKDAAWLMACQTKKWVHLNGAINYQGATVLDVGSHCGYVCFRSILAGAKNALGIEKRADMANLARIAARKLRLESATTFRHGDWLLIEPLDGRFDIVHCLGLLHYFPAQQYERAFKALARVAIRTLAVEMRLSTKPGVTIETTARDQTLPSREWLSRVLEESEFGKPKIFPVDGAFRQLWISERIK